MIRTQCPDTQDGLSGKAAADTLSLYRECPSACPSAPEERKRTPVQFASVEQARIAAATILNPASRPTEYEPAWTAVLEFLASIDLPADFAHATLFVLAGDGWRAAGNPAAWIRAALLNNRSQDYRRKRMRARKALPLEKCQEIATNGW